MGGNGYPKSLFYGWPITELQTAVNFPGPSGVMGDVFGLFSFTLAHAWKVVTHLHSKELPPAAGSMYKGAQKKPQKPLRGRSRLRHLATSFRILSGRKPPACLELPFFSSSSLCSQEEICSAMRIPLMGWDICGHRRFQLYIYFFKSKVPYFYELAITSLVLGSVELW